MKKALVRGALKGGMGVAKIISKWSDYTLIDPQKWLEWEYFTLVSKLAVEKLDLNEASNYLVEREKKFLTGSLSLQGFKNLKEFYSDDAAITDLDLSDCSQLEILRLGSLTLALKLADHCPKLKILNLGGGGREYTKLITSLKLGYCPNLEELNLSGGFLTSLDFLKKLNPEKLKKLDISNNDFSRQDLAIFAPFVNLEELIIGSVEFNLCFNRFYGSLKSLKNLTKLKVLDISNTDIDSGLEYLPESLVWEEIYCSSEERPESKVRKIAEQINKNEKWQEFHPDFTVEQQEKWKRVLKKGKGKVQEWIQVGFAPHDAELVGYLKAYHGDSLTPQQALEKGTIEQLKINHQDYCDNWKSLNKDHFFESNQREWKENEFSYDETKQWIDIGLSPSEVVLAAYFRHKGYDPTTVSLEELKTLGIDAKWYLDRYYAKEKRAEITELNISNRNLGSSLDLSDFVNLEILRCSNNKLNKLDVRNCVKLQVLECSKNQLTGIDFPFDLEKLNLKYINFSDNDKLDTAELDSQFSKLLPPSLAKRKVSAVGKKELEKIIDEKVKSNIPGEIRDAQYFSTWWNPNCALVVNKVVWYAIRLVVYEPEKKEMPEVLKVIKISEHIYQDKIYAKVQELKEKLESDNPILVLYSHNSGFSPQEVMKRIDLPAWRRTKEEPDNYFKPMDLVWRTMKGMPHCYHVAVYLGDSKVANIGSSKFVKASKVKDNKKLLGARVDHWKDFFNDTEKLIRFHPVIPFKRSEVIWEQITKAVLADYGQKEYSFLGHNCEHFATLAVCGIPFSTQADKIMLLVNRIYLDLEKEIKKSEQAFAEMSNSETFKAETRKIEKNKLEREITELQTKKILSEEEENSLIKLQTELSNLIPEEIKYLEYCHLTKLKEIKKKNKLDEREQKRLNNLVLKIKELEELFQSLPVSNNLGDASSEVEFNNTSYCDSTTSLVYVADDLFSADWWKQIIQKKSHILGTIEKIIPFGKQQNQVLVINKVFLYAVRLFEYDAQTDKLTELKRFAKNKLGYTNLEDALEKVKLIIEDRERDAESPQTSSQIEIPPKNN